MVLPARLVLLAMEPLGCGFLLEEETCFQGLQSRHTSSFLSLLHDKDVISWLPTLAACYHIL